MSNKKEELLAKLLRHRDDLRAHAARVDQLIAALINYHGEIMDVDVK